MRLIIDEINKVRWGHYARSFTDYSIYQTWAYQQIRAETDGQKLSRAVILDDDGNVLTMCHVRIKKIKPLGLRVGYVQGGPLFCGKEGEIKCTVEALRALRDAYIGKSVDVLRLIPNRPNDEMGRKLTEMVETSGFQNYKGVTPYQTILLSLDSPNKALRTRLHKGWRRHLSKAERSHLEIVDCNDVESFKVLERLYLDTKERKGFKGLDPRIYTRTQSILLPMEKMKLILAYRHGQAVTAHLTSSLGNSSIFLLGGSNKEGLACRASYLVWWKAIMESKRLGMKRYDLGGINTMKDPGVYQFKSGMGGEEYSYIGLFIAYKNLSVKKIWCGAERVYGWLKSKFK